MRRYPAEFARVTTRSALEYQKGGMIFFQDFSKKKTVRLLNTRREVIFFSKNVYIDIIYAEKRAGISVYMYICIYTYIYIYNVFMYIVSCVGYVG